jgi:hypothetical protein
MGANLTAESPLTLSLSQQARLGELASQSVRIRKRMRMERERCFTLDAQFERPFSHGEKDRMRGDSPFRYAVLR